MDISIVVPTFNSAATLPATLESIRNQTSANADVVIVDGGSSDATLELAQQAGDIVGSLISEPDDGIYDAVNKGIARAQGDLIGVVGSDDTLAPGTFLQLAHAFKHHPADIFAGQAILVEPNASKADLRVDEDYGPGALLSGIPFCHNAMYVTPGCYKDVGSYDLRYSICGDADWVHRAIRAGRSCTRINEPLVHFALTGVSSTRSDQTMAETYNIVARNFDNLTLEDAEALFRAVRGWSGGEEVDSILRRYPESGELRLAAVQAFLARARRLAQELHNNQQTQDSRSSPNSKKTTMNSGTARGIKSIFKRAHAKITSR